jgi:ribosomal protein L37E
VNATRGSYAEHAAEFPEQEFGPEATIEGHVRRLWEIYAEQRKLDGEEHNLRRIITEHMRRTGEVVQVEGLPAMRPIVVGASAGGGPVVVARFDRQEYGRCRRCRNRGQELKRGICGSCGDDLRQEHDAEEAGA